MVTFVIFPPHSDWLYSITLTVHSRIITNFSKFEHYGNVWDNLIQKATQLNKYNKNRVALRHLNLEMEVYNKKWGFFKHKLQSICGLGSVMLYVWVSGITSEVVLAGLLIDFPVYSFCLHTKGDFVRAIIQLWSKITPELEAHVVWSFTDTSYNYYSRFSCWIIYVALFWF